MDERYDIELDSHIKSWTEAEKMLHSFYPEILELTGTWWEQIKKDKRCYLMIARSRLIPEHEPGTRVGLPTILGFIAGGTHPTAKVPHIFSVVVLPDERRTGIATDLVRRFFAHTAYRSARMNILYTKPREPLVVANFLVKKFKGRLEQKWEGKRWGWWRFQITNPHIPSDINLPKEAVPPPNLENPPQESEYDV